MNLLGIVQRLHRESGGAGSTPASVVSQTGEMGRLVDWANEAWMTIQRLQHWSWQWEQASSVIAATTNVTAATVPVQRYLRHTAMIGTRRLQYLPWADFSVVYPDPATGSITDWTVRPDNAIVTSTKPTDDTTISVQRYAVPTYLAVANDSTPTMPERFHMAIVWRALMDASDYDEAGVSRAVASAKYAEVIGDAFSEGRAVIQLGEPLL